MGLLDQVIGAALASKGQPAPGQTSSTQSAQDLDSVTAGSSTGSGRTSGTDQFKKNGFEGVINSWIGTGQNQAISPTELREALGQKTVNDLSRQAGAPQNDLLSQLSDLRSDYRRN
jgi:uncharacterized protein YidB (DUF937 family)